MTDGYSVTLEQPPTTGIRVTTPGSFEHCFLVAGGARPEPSWLSRTTEGYRVWAVDRGVGYCRMADVRPETVVGDMDSVSESDLQWARDNGARLLRYPSDKDLTDLQLTLRHIGETGQRVFAFVAGGWGGRLDHAICNCRSLIWAQRQGLIAGGCLIGPDEFLLIMQGPDRCSLYAVPDDTIISLLPFSEPCRGVSLSGARWELKDRDLSLFDPYTISNRMVGTEGKTSGTLLSFRSGWLGLYMFMDF